ncbi:MAG TPA: fenitrothion hydrolase [Solirubrobacterales bacterium]
MSLAPFQVVGHALVGRQDLPIPDWLFAWGASVVLIISFFVLSFAWHTTRFEEQSWRPGPRWLTVAVLNPVTQFLCGAIGVFLLGVTVWSGLNGTEAPDRNFAVTFVFVTVYLGFIPFSVVFGDVFRAFNPWRAIGRVAGGVFKAIAGQSAPPALAYPEKLGRWPAAAGLVAIGWLELVYGQGGFQIVGLTGHTVAVASLVYTAYTLVMMTLFGAEKWLERGETFSVYFHMFSTLAPFEARDGQVGIRRALSASTKWVAEAPGSVALVLTAIGVTTFDGAGEGMLLNPINTVEGWLGDIGIGPLAALRLSNTLFMALCLGFVAGLFWAGIYGMHTVRTQFSTRRLGDLFAHAFIPIAFAYLFAHYFSFVVFSEQAQFSFLLSDPLGDGSDFFGTASSGIDYAVISANLISYVQVAALVIGHAIALALGHDRALKVYGDPRLATRSQYWMLALMVGFTSFGLFLLFEANG